NQITARHFAAPLVDGDPEIFERCAIDIERASIRPKYTDVLRRQVEHQPKLSFLFVESLFRNFALFDFYTRAEPLDDSSRLVAQGYLAVDEPAVFTVGAPHARFGYEGVSGRNCGAPDVYERFDVFRMDCDRPAPAQKVCEREANIFEPTPVQEVESAVRKRSMNERRSGID